MESNSNKEEIKMLNNRITMLEKDNEALFLLLFNRFQTSTKYKNNQQRLIRSMFLYFFRVFSIFLDKYYRIILIDKEIIPQFKCCGSFKEILFRNQSD
jgi:hypothetical protein